MSGATPAPPRDLRAWLRILRERGDLAEVDLEVDPVLEIPEIHRRVIAAGGPALLFNRVRGSPHRLATNLFGTRARVAAAFGDGIHETVARLADAPRTLLPPSPGALWRERGLLRRLARAGFRRTRRAPVTEVREGPEGAARLPATVSWPGDGGPFLTLPLVLTGHPETGVTNLGIYRMQRFDDGTFGMHWQIGKGGGFHHDLARRRGEPLPVNVALGGPPALVLAAATPLPENMPELLFASLVLGERLRLAEGTGEGLPVVADAEFVLTGTVAPDEARPEGPFGDHYGYYSLRHDYPVFRPRTIWRRRDAILPATVVGKPRQEDWFIGDFIQEALAPLFPLVMPNVRDLWSYGETGYHALGAAVVRERYRREAMAAAFRILGEGQLSLTKFLLVIDRPLDLRDFRAVLTHVLERADFRTDLHLFANLSMDTLDYAGPAVNEGSKGVLLGLGEPIRSLPREFAGELPPGARAAAVFCPGCLVLEADTWGRDPDAPRRFAAWPGLVDWPLLVVAEDAARTACSAMNFLWTTFTRFDPATDVHGAREDLCGHHVSLTPPVAFDARLRPGYPPELFPDPESEQRVDRRWGEYFPKNLAAGDSRWGNLDRQHV